MRSTALLLSTSSVSMTRAKKSSRIIRQLRFFRNPSWESRIRLLPSRFVFICNLINLSIVLQTIEVGLIVLWIPSSPLFVTLADFQSSGIIPVSADLLKVLLRNSQSMSSRDRSTLGCRSQAK